MLPEKVIIVFFFLFLKALLLSKLTFDGLCKILIFFLIIFLEIFIFKLFDGTSIKCAKLYKKFIILLRISIKYLFFIIFKSCKVSGHKSCTQKINFALFFQENIIAGITWKIGDVA